MTSKGEHLSIETKRKLSKALSGKNNPRYGKHLSEETKRKLSSSIKKGFSNGRITWNKGKPRTKETKLKISETRKKKFANGELKVNFKGKHHTEKTKEKYRKKWKEKYEKGFINPRKDIKVSEETKQKQSKTKKILYAKGLIISPMKGKNGEKNPAWKGGISFEPYNPEFNNNLKKYIRDRDYHICQLCNKPENGSKLRIHHIDYDKKNINSINLISLCNSCHIKTNYNREYWIDFFYKYKIER
jgi:hypothetical protein